MSGNRLDVGKVLGYFSIAWLCAGSALYGPAAIAAPGPQSCHEQASAILGKKVKYCIDRTRPDEPARAGESVVYFMHGIFGDEKGWVGDGYAEALDALRKQRGIPAATFVTFETSGTSFFSDAKAQPTGPAAFESWLLKEFIPFIERTYGVCRQRSCRAVAGVSMGGFGAIKTALRHPGLFSSVGANIPALAPFNLHEPNEKWKEYFGAHPIGVIQGMLLLRFARGVFHDPEYADQNDPIWLAQNFPSVDHFPALYFNMGGNDKYGFQVGYARLRKVLDERKIPYMTHFEPTSGHKVPLARSTEMLKFLLQRLGRR